MLKRFFGWQKDSGMPSVYVHLAQTDIEDKYYEMYGLHTSERNLGPEAVSRAATCPACNAKNPTGYVFCMNCDKPLQQGARSDAKVEGILDLLVADDTLRQQFDVLLERAYQKKRPV